MTSHDVQAVLDVLRTIPDPEMPISIVDLGLIEQITLDERPGGLVARIDVLPTFVGCPALPMIEDEICAKVGAMDGIGDVHVRFINDPPWSVDRITPAGRASLKEHGVTVPESGSRLDVTGHSGGAVEFRTSAIPCPFCDSNSTRLDSPFGPTRCRMIYYCDDCRNTFEHLKRV